MKNYENQQTVLLMTLLILLRQSTNFLITPRINPSIYNDDFFVKRFECVTTISLTCQHKMKKYNKHLYSQKHKKTNLKTSFKRLEGKKHLQRKLIDYILSPSWVASKVDIRQFFSQYFKVRKVFKTLSWVHTNLLEIRIVPYMYTKRWYHPALENSILIICTCIHVFAISCSCFLLERYC